MRSFIASLALLLVSFAATAQSTFPPTPKVLLAVNPITNKIYSVNESANSVTVFDGAANTSRTITVGSRPQFIAVNPITNRIYVNNGGDATVSVIDGSTDTNITPTPLQVGSQGPMAINAETNVVYIVRMTSLASDEVTFLNGNDNTWYTIATESFQPTALTINPVTNTLYVAHYGTGDVRVISGVYNNTVLHPTTFSIGAWSKPFAIAASPSNDKVYVITEDSRGPIGIIDGATRTAQFPLPTPGHAAGPKSVVVNPTTGVAYAAFNGEVIAINGTSYTYIPVATGAGQVGLAVNPLTNKIYVSSDSGTLTIIDGDNNTTTTVAIPAGAQSVAVNPVTNKTIVHGPTRTVVDGTGTPHGSVISTTITPQPGNSSGPNPTFAISATNFSSNPLPIRGVFVQMDGRDGAWTAASGGGGSYSASFSGLTAGSHTLNAFAIEGQVAPTATGPESMPLVGALASYTFTVGPTKADPTVSLLSSGNPSASGQAVTFTASVTGNGTNAPTGTMAFKDGATTLCAAVTITSGSASCSTSTLGSGAHTITATYSGDTNYNTASATLTQNVGKVASTTTVTSSVNPSNVGQSVTFTAAITGGAGTATGTVTFTDGSTTLCSAVALASGSATCSTSTLAGGAHTINATYSGDATRNTSSGSVTQTVNAPAGPPARSEITNPAPGSTLTTSSVTFSWTAGSQVAERYFQVGTTPGGSQIYAGYQGGASSKTVSGIPQDGSTVYVRLMSYLGGAWNAADYTYIGGSGTPPPPAAPAKSTITSPANNSTLTSSSVTFTWDAGSSVAERYLMVGTSMGGSQVYAGYQGGASSRTVGGIPQDGSTVYVRLMSYINGMWQSADYTYVGGNGTAPPQPPASSGPSTITSPQPGSTLTGATVTFSWTTGKDVAERYFTVGSTPGGSDVYGGYQGGATSRTVSGLPTDGRVVYVRLMSWMGGGWQIADYTYTATR